MANEMHSPDSLEALWQESEEAGQAGVFRRSRVAADAIVQPVDGPVATGSVNRRLLWIGIAAALALAAGSWTFLIRSELASLRNRRDFASALPISPGARLAVRLGDCLQGPGAGGSLGPCSDQDLDGDGDVDLRDLSRGLARASRTP